MEQSRKKELIAAYRQRKVIGCVYEVRCAGMADAWCVLTPTGRAPRIGLTLLSPPAPA